ncbi:hypothetical protein [Arthrobacter subterraneus]|nr:hypothetical protein [Arthrobacter subterraneus]
MSQWRGWHKTTFLLLIATISYLLLRQTFPSWVSVLIVLPVAILAAYTASSDARRDRRRK